MRRVSHRLGLGLIVIGVLAISVTLVAAERVHYTPPVPPYDLSPGLHEEGRYLMSATGSFSRLWPVRPFPFAKDSKEAKTEAGESGSSQGGALSIPGSGRSRVKLGEPILKPTDTRESTLGSFLSPTGSGEDRTARLEDGVRDMIGRLNSK